MYNKSINLLAHAYAHYYTALTVPAWRCGRCATSAAVAPPPGCPKTVRASPAKGGHALCSRAPALAPGTCAAAAERKAQSQRQSCGLDVHCWMWFICLQQSNAERISQVCGRAAGLGLGLAGFHDADYADEVREMARLLGGLARGVRVL